MHLIVITTRPKSRWWWDPPMSIPVANPDRGRLNTFSWSFGGRVLVVGRLRLAGQHRNSFQGRLNVSILSAQIRDCAIDEGESHIGDAILRGSATRVATLEVLSVTQSKSSNSFIGSGSHSINFADQNRPRISVANRSCRFLLVLNFCFALYAFAA